MYDIPFAILMRQPGELEIVKPLRVRGQHLEAYHYSVGQRVVVPVSSVLHMGGTYPARVLQFAPAVAEAKRIGDERYGRARRVANPDPYWKPVFAPYTEKSGRKQIGSKKKTGLMMEDGKPTCRAVKGYMKWGGSTGVSPKFCFYIPGSLPKGKWVKSNPYVMHNFLWNQARQMVPMQMQIAEEYFRHAKTLEAVRVGHKEMWENFYKAPKDDLSHYGFQEVLPWIRKMREVKLSDRSVGLVFMFALFTIQMDTPAAENNFAYVAPSYEAICHQILRVKKKRFKEVHDLIGSVIDHKDFVSCGTTNIDQLPTEMWGHCWMGGMPKSKTTSLPQTVRDAFLYTDEINNWRTRDFTSDRDFRRKICLEWGSPHGVGVAKTAFSLEILGRNTACLDSWMLQFLSGWGDNLSERAQLTEDIAGWNWSEIFREEMGTSNNRKASEASPLKKAYPVKKVTMARKTLYEIYEILEDILVEMTHVPLNVPNIYAAAQWQTWEAMRGVRATHGPLWDKLVKTQFGVEDWRV